MISIQELRQLNKEQLQKELTAAIAERLKLKMEVKVGSKKDSSTLKLWKKYIAQIKTLQQQLNSIKK
ncbi:50S ribosomal protein L29 [Candidatus Peregrinibacteria bacterium RIFOXYC2_FULL_33_13]|nr:MAG: hypothetical protein UR27_C0003G0021 [Candidatus Peregrinibacteria bacterium GW2011_GWA2_33_10]KKP40747.1 MAG: hypothetical protein UR30_C0004G0005 [Candidatus Peregrinibacteria bacterium GW2011_GWC2_33_13]OGJ51106.1 MAG: 50S ribosomal protein L29 [Candidatus Peregrinibacteria bacterium RIFOXYA2_FULL_33_7]OGJ55450.1 MAG: 50S ribosomal protein L29 [Candidatus Peregrinibacteria bacterium RIFOXYC2_FULL_33_13]